MALGPTLLYLLEGTGLLLLLLSSTLSLFPSDHCKARRETVRRDRKRTMISARLWKDRELGGSLAHHRRTQRKRIWSVVHLLCWKELLGGRGARLTESVFQIGTETTYLSITAGLVERKGRTVPGLRAVCRRILWKTQSSRLLSEHFTFYILCWGCKEIE